MDRREATLVGRDLCEDIITMSFSRPEGWTYRPGQWLTLTVPTVDGELTHTLSHASAPSDATVDIGTRLSGSEFKKALAALEPGGRVLLGGPGGRLAVPQAARGVVFLTGGVGITPVRSILRDHVARGARLDDALLIYGNRKPECSPYMGELDALASTGLRLVPVYENASAEWSGERGLIDAAMIRRHLKEIEGAGFVISGPPVMVSVMRAVLKELEVVPELIAVESFG